MAKRQATEIRVLKIELDQYRVNAKPIKVKSTNAKNIINEQSKIITALKTEIELQKTTIREFAIQAIKQVRTLKKNKKKSSPYKPSLKKYDLTPSEYANMLVKQKGVCGICGRTNKNNKNLVIDHCHETEKVRALLCTRCNFVLGWADDNAETLEKAAQYIKIHRKRAKIKLIG